ncbi:MAG: GyrI-like domain-containing protein [Steroidobacteraceae bacterium]
MEKTDLRKELKQFYRPSAKTITEVQVPPFRYLMIDGRGDPNTSIDYAAAVEALFSVSYTAKFMLRKAAEKRDYAVMPLEGLWWAHDLGAFQMGDRANWQWTMMIMQPHFVPDAVLQAAMREVTAKKQSPGVAKLRIEIFEEGLCAQTLHVGPFTAEGPVIERLHAHIEARSGLRGKHHEIYLTDIRRADPSRWKTVIRQPMR